MAPKKRRAASPPTDQGTTWQDGGLTFEEGFRTLLPRIGPELGAMFNVTLRLDDTACGRYGCVLFTDRRDFVVKITGDPSEAHGWLYVQDKQTSGNLDILGGVVTVCDIRRVRVDFPAAFGPPVAQNFGVALLERVVPVRDVHHRGSDRKRLTERVGHLLDRDLEPVRSIYERIGEIGVAAHQHSLPALRRQARHAPPVLRSLVEAMVEAGRDDVWFEDVRGHNVGWRLSGPPTLVLYDMGRVEIDDAPRRMRLRRRWRESKPVFLSSSVAPRTRRR